MQFDTKLPKTIQLIQILIFKIEFTPKKKRIIKLRVINGQNT